MITFSQFLVERYFTTDDPDVKEKHIDAVHDMLRQSYKNVGGYGRLGHGTDEESAAIKKDIRDPNVLMKLHHKNGVPHSVMLYKKQHGRKLIAAGTNGTVQGKDSLNSTIGDDKSHERAWGEVSHAMEKIYDKHGMPTVSNDKAEHLTKKRIIRKHGETHYDREIGGEVHTKTIKGYPKP